MYDVIAQKNQHAVQQSPNEIPDDVTLFIESVHSALGNLQEKSLLPNLVPTTRGVVVRQENQNPG